MKQILLVFMFMLGALNLMAQTTLPVPVDKETGKVLFSKVEQVDSTLSKTDLHQRALEWSSSYFGTTKNTVTANDKEAGLLFINAVKKESVFYSGREDKVNLYYTVKVYVKDGRYKVDFTDISIETMAGGKPFKLEAEAAITDDAIKNDKLGMQMAWRNGVLMEMLDVQSSLKKLMSKSKQSDNW